MSEVTLKKISYGELREKEWLTDNDHYGLAAFVDDNVRQTFLNNPNNDNDTKTSILFAIDEGVVVGRHLLYGTAIKDGDSIIKAQSSGSTEVHESQRGKGIGSMINQWTLNNDEYPMYICSLLSPACLRIMEKKENDCIIFDFPELVRIVNTEAAFAVRGLKGFPLILFKNLSNFFIRLFNLSNGFRLRRLKKKYDIRKEVMVPEWAGRMCLNDGHKYGEYHDTTWLQWNLIHNLSGKTEDVQSFYAIYNKTTNIPVGFFFTKERVRDDIKKCHMVCGTICEWASIDDELSEADINLLAVPTFSPNVYHIRTVSDDKDTVKRLKHYGFIGHGSMQMGFKDKLKQYPDMANQRLWRIRFGCCNSIVY